MDLKLQLRVTNDENQKKIPCVYFECGGNYLKEVPLYEAAEMLVNLWESTGIDRENAIKTISLHLEYMKRAYEHELLGKAGDRKIETLVLKHFGIEKK